jgi:hypothetical protein
VPGWFQATLTLYDGEGVELAHADDFRFHPDPAFSYEIPADGEYVIEVRDAIYRGRDDFVYRLRIGELPFVTDAFPMGTRAGSRTTVEVDGWNLQGQRLAFDARSREPGVLPIAMQRGAFSSNAVPLIVDTLPELWERRERSESGAAHRAQPVTPPVVVNGRIDEPGDWDVYAFEARAGDAIVAEIDAHRLGSPLDSVLRLTDAAGADLGFNDDFEDPSEGLTTHHADSRLTASLPADGVYELHVGDAQSKGGRAYAYRLRIGPRRPDFALRAVPSSVTARAGGTVAVTIHALRKDGFPGRIDIVLRDPPTGFALRDASVPAGEDKATVRLRVPNVPSKEPYVLSLEGRAGIGGLVLARPVVPADDMMQAFFYRHFVPAQELQVMVLPRPKGRNRAGAARARRAAQDVKSASKGP